MVTKRIDNRIVSADYHKYCVLTRNYYDFYYELQYETYTFIAAFIIANVLRSKYDNVEIRNGKYLWEIKE